jgi:hypothetical protein
MHLLSAFAFLLAMIFGGASHPSGPSHPALTTIGQCGPGYFFINGVCQKHVVSVKP